MPPNSFRVVLGGVRGAELFFGFLDRVFFVMERPYTEPKAWDAGGRESVCSAAASIKTERTAFRDVCVVGRWP